MIDLFRAKIGTPRKTLVGSKQMGRNNELMSFQKKLVAGEFVVLAEMDTPKGVDISQMITHVRRIKGSVDAVVIPDLDKDVMRMSALGGGALMRQQGIDPIIHVCCRDRNRIALQAELLSAHVLGVHNLIVVPGEDMSYGDHPDAKPVNDLDELELFGAIQSLQDGVDMAGLELSGAPHFFVGFTMAPFADDRALELELETAKKKVDAGARFIITPAVFDLDRFVCFSDRVKELGVPVIPTVFLLKTVGIARYMSINEPGAHISEGLIKRIRQAPDRTMECVRIAGESVKALKELAQGVHLMTLGWEHQIPAILEHAGL
jgi:methylenetetrahydrofolate reductase (NADPH)